MAIVVPAGIGNAIKSRQLIAGPPGNAALMVAACLAARSIA